MRDLLLAILALTSVAACHADEPKVSPPLDDPPTASSTATATATPRPSASASAAPSASSAPDPIYACQSDADCVAVPRAGCCNNGYKEAIARGQEEAYRAAHPCARKRMICPQFVINDRRQPLCDSAEQQCVMVGGAP
jgi:hypothetical protein